MTDVESLLVEGFRVRVSALVKSRQLDFRGLDELELKELGSEGAEAALSTMIWQSAIGDRWPTSTVIEFLGITRQALHKRLRNGKVVGVPGRGVTWFPTWQFDRSNRTVRPVAVALVAAFREHLEHFDARVLASWATTVQPELGMTPAEWLEAVRDDEALVRLAKRSASELAS